MDGAERGGCDRAELTAAGEDEAEEIVLLVDAMECSIGSDELEPLHRIDLEAEHVRGVAEAADRQRAADGGAEIVGEHERTAPPRCQVIDELEPPGAAADGDELARLVVDERQLAKVDHGAVADERLTSGGMTAAAELVGEAD